MNEYLIRFTDERPEERVVADTLAHDLFDLVFLANGRETRRVAVAEISNVEPLAEDQWMPAISNPSTGRPREILPRSEERSNLGSRFQMLFGGSRGTRGRALAIATFPSPGMTLDTIEADDIG